MPSGPRKKNIRRGKADFLSVLLWEMILAQFLNLHVIQLYRRRTAEDLHRYFQFLLLVVHFFNDTIEVVERSFDDLDSFTNDKWLTHAYAAGFSHFIHFTKHFVNLGLTQGY